MFKAAFPWAQQEEEAAEKDYIKSLDSTSREEVAGNVWIHPDQGKKYNKVLAMTYDSTDTYTTLALLLADEYGIRQWILALLDPEAITHGTSDPKKNIQSPPAYKTKDMVNGAGNTNAGKGSKRSRASKAASASAASASTAESPTKKTPRKVATPRKPRTTKGRGKSTEPDAAVNGESPKMVKVDIETESRPTSAGKEEVEKTKLAISMPSDHPDLELPNDAEGMLAKARDMVAEAEKISGAAPSTAKGKRKASDLLDGDAPESPSSLHAPKRARTVDLELRKERIKRRALTGIAASLAIG